MKNFRTLQEGLHIEQCAYMSRCTIISFSFEFQDSALTIKF